MKKLLLIMLCFVPYAIHAQDAKPEFGIKFGGYVKTDIMYDTRQSEVARDGILSLYPKPESLDSKGEDINKTGSFNMLSLQTRLTGKISAPDFLGAKTSGTIEGEFFGNSEIGINELRLRHAFLQLDWANTQLLVGQYWNQIMFIETIPETVAYGAGVPFQALARSPQIRVAQKFGGFSVLASASSQRDFTANGPDSYSAAYARNAGIPTMTVGWAYRTDGLSIGANGQYKSIKPRLVTTGVANAKYVTEELLNSIAVGVNAKIYTDNFSLKLSGLYSQNSADLTVPGGYYVKFVDPLTGAETYSNVNMLNAFADAQYGKVWVFGLFGGYLKNLGTSDKVTTNTFYGRAGTIGSVLRLAPRLVYKMGKINFGLEFEYTQAEYGTPDVTDKMKIINTKTYDNLRVLLGAYLYF